MSPLAAGDQLGRYRILRPLGAGAMGEVYLAEDPQIDRQLAIKTVRIEAGRPAEVAERRQRLLREARATGRLLHPHVVTLFDAGEDQGVFYLAFEYVEGADLAQRLDDGPPLSLGEALELVRQAADGLDYAHRQGIVHRDIKPSNLMLTTAGQLKITDFGIAKMVGQATELTMTGSVVGSPHYLSPEQIRGEELDGRSDLFSLGVVLYELLTRRRPFRGETLTTLVYQILHQEPEGLPARRAGLAPQLDELVRRMLAKDRAARFASAREAATEVARLQRELDPALLAAPAAPGEEDEALQETVRLSTPDALRPLLPATPPPPPPPPPAAVSPGVPAAAPAAGRRLPLLVAGLALAAVVLLVGGGLLGRAWLQRAPAPPEAGQTATPAPLPVEPEGTEPGPELAATPVPPPRPLEVAPVEVREVRAAPESPEQSAPAAAPAAREPRPAATPKPTPAPTPEPTPEDEPEPEMSEEATAEAATVDRTVESGLHLSFQVEPDDAFVLVGRTLIGRASEWNAAQPKKGGRAYTLPRAGAHLVRIRHEGSELRLLVRAQPGKAGVTTISANLGLPGGGLSAGSGVRRVRVSEGIALRVVPEDAEVTVAGERLGTARDFRGGVGGKRLLSLPAGVHRVVLSAPGHAPAEIDLEIDPRARDRRTTVDVRLPRQ
jgi:serine/threonine-protein kinase